MSRASGTVVACYTIDGKLVKTYPSASQAAKSRHLFKRTIDKCIRGDVTTVKGLQWKRFPINEVPDRIEPLEKTTTAISIRPVAKLNEKGEIIEVYPSIRNASINNHIDTHTLRDRLNEKYPCDGKAKFRYLTDNEIAKYKFKKGQKIDNKTKAVIQITLDGKYTKSYPSIRAALISLGKSPLNPGISKCLKGEFDTAFGYRWKYKNYPNISKRNKKKTCIFALDENNNVIKRYSSVKEAALELGVTPSSINSAIRLNWKIKGYRWKRK